MSSSLSMLLLVLAATAGSGIAQNLNPRVAISSGCSGFDEPCAITLTEGMDRTVSISLDEPIVCGNQNEECVVVVNFSNSHPHIVSVDPCLVRWERDQWHQTRTVRVTAVQSYQETHVEQRVHLETHVVATATYYQGFDPLDLYIKSENRRTAGCSANGDPHYRSFDGLYWHFYDGTSRNPSRVTLYRATDRDFIIQNQLRGFPARNCAMAGREGPDRVVINSCGRQVQIITDFNSEDSSRHPRLTVSGSTYTVYFHSGAWMRAVARPGYVGVFVQSVDYQTSCGICGNFDGNPNNDAPGRSVTWARTNSYSALFPCQQVPSVLSGSPTLGDIWDWQYNAADFQNNVEVVPQAQQNCPYEIQRIILPELNTDDIDDITDALEELADQIRDQNGGGNFQWDEGTNDNVEIQEYPFNLSVAACRDEIDASVAVATCRQRYPAFDARIANYTEDCAIDYSEMGGPNSELAVTFLEGTVRAMRQDCLAIAIQTGDAEDASLRQALCLNACSNAGSCGVDARCTCNQGRGGVDCSVDLTRPPEIVHVSDLVYDTAGHQQPPLSPSEILVSGHNFLRSNATRCRFGTIVTDGFYVGPTQVICRVPRFNRDNIHRGAVPLEMDLSVSNDNGTRWSPNPERFPFLFFDSTCQRCHYLGNCTRNPETCTIGSGEDARCFLADHTDPDSGNICLECQPNISGTSMTYMYHRRLCRPQFTTDIYQQNIVREATAGQVILTVDATANPLLQADPNYSIRYEYIHSLVGSDPMFEVDPNTGEVSIIDSVDITEPPFMNMAHAAQNPTLFNGFFQVRATDPQGHSVTTQVNIELVPDGFAPIFPDDGFHGTVSENATAGTPVANASDTSEVLAVVADNLDTDNVDPSSVRYTWHSEPGALAGALALNPVTGEVTVNDTSKLDFEAPETVLHFENSTLRYQARASDGLLLFAIVDVLVQVTNVPEPPTAIFVNNTQNVVINENVNGPVGNLSTSDPEGGSFTYTILDATSPFTIQQYPDGVTYLNLTTSFDFESGTPNTLVVNIRSTDAGGLSVDVPITVQIVDVNEAPHSLSVTSTDAGFVVDGGNFTLSENTPLVTALGLVSAIDPEGRPINCFAPNQYFRVADVDNCVSAQSTQTSVNNLIVESRLDFETASTFDIIFVCEDCEGHQSPQRTYTVNVLDANEPPEIVNWENTQAAPIEESSVRSEEVLLGTVTVRDDAGSVSDPVISPANASLIRITTPQCNMLSGAPMICTADVILLPNAVVSFEEYAATLGAGVFPLGIILTDGVDQPGTRESGEGSVTMTVANVPEPPTGILMSQSTISEDVTVGQVVSNITIIDEDLGNGQFNVALTSNPGNAFAVSPILADGRRRQAATGGVEWQLTVATPSAFDFETATSITFSISVTDLEMGQNSQPMVFTRSVTITDAPMRIVANTSEISGIPGLAGVQFSVLNMDRPDLASGIQWQVSGITGWGSLTTTNGAFTDLQVDPTQGSLMQAGDMRNVDVTVIVPGFPSIAQRFTLEVIDVQIPPVITTNLSTFVNIVMPEFSSDATPLDVVSVSVVDPESTPQQRLEIFVGRLVAEMPNNPTENAREVYLQPLGDAYINRFIASETYIAANDMSDAVGPFYVVEDSSYSRCTQLLAVNGQFDCTLQILSKPSPLPEWQAAGIVNGTGLFGTGGRFIVAAKDGALRGTDMDMELAAFAPFSVAYPMADQTVVTNPMDNNDVIFVDATTMGPIIIVDASSDEDDSTSSGTIVGVVVALLLILLVVAAAYFYHQHRLSTARDLFDGKDTNSNPAYGGADPVPYEQTPFVPGVENAAFDWYKPTMSRKECTEHLMKQGEGAFVVRDSDSNPGWFMLGVKTQNVVIHDKIRQTENNEYQLLPSSGAAADVPQPCFATVPDLIDHYLKFHDGMPYTLIAANPIYDNHQLAQERTGVLQKARHDSQLPDKQHEYAQMDAIGTGSNMGGDSVGNPMYFADGQQQQQGTYAAPYLDVTPNDAAQANAGYLDLVPNEPTKPSTTGYSDVPASGNSYATGLAAKDPTYEDIPAEPVSMTQASGI